MKRNSYIYHIFAFLILALSSCTPDAFEQQMQEDGITLNFFNSSIPSKADTVEPIALETDSGSEKERLIKRLDIFLYAKDKTEEGCVFYKHLSGLNEIGSIRVPVYVSEDIANRLFPDTSTECEVYAIANLPDSVSFDGSENMAELKAVVHKSLEFSDVVASDGGFRSPESFLMSGKSVAVKTVTDDQVKIGGDVIMARAASKVTIRVSLPDTIQVKVVDEKNQPVIDPGTQKQKVEIWKPLFNNKDPKEGIQFMHIGFHKGLNKTVVDGTNVREASDVFETLYTEDFKYIDRVSSVVEGVARNYNRYNCEVSFYTYAFSWESKDNDVEAPYFTLMIPWIREEDEQSGATERYTTYYYQVVINGRSKKVERNVWYDMSLNVGILGSRTYNTPQLLEDMSYYVLDWSDGNKGLNEDVNLNEWRYLVIPETYVEINNTTTGYLPFEASHKVAWALEWPGSLEGLDELEKYNENNKYSAYHINCSGKTPVSVQLSGVSNNSFSISPSGDEIMLVNDFPTNVFSPIYYHLKVWLDLTPNGVLDADEQSFVERVTFVQYPPIYIIPSQSKEHSVYVNKIDYTTSNISYNSNKYILGQCRGESSDGDHMYVINVSSFNADDTFKYRDGNQYAYLIGDPRIMDSDADLNDDGWNMQNSWAEDGNGRKLTYYYPTANKSNGEDHIFRVISPRFRVASFLGGYSNGSTPEGAAMRCASYQEDGFPAGRWRLPTTAEINFVISLQQKGAIQNIFYGGNYYYSSTDQVRNQSTIEVREIDWESTSFTGSIRCVYDEWYWGSVREADKKAGKDDEYEFTWGDRER